MERGLKPRTGTLHPVFCWDPGSGTLGYWVGFGMEGGASGGAGWSQCGWSIDGE